MAWNIFRDQYKTDSYQDFHFEEIENYDEYFKRRPLSIISVKEGNNIKIYAAIRVEGKTFEIPKSYNASIVTVRGKEIDVLKEIEGDYCVTYYGNYCSSISLYGASFPGWSDTHL